MSQRQVHSLASCVRIALTCAAALNLVGCRTIHDARIDAPYLFVLGTAQDGGVPQVGHFGHPGWRDPKRRRLVSSVAIVDPRNGKRWLIDATPDFREQLHRLHRQTAALAGRGATAPPLDGIFLTHAHIGHYTGLMFLGQECMGARGVPVSAMPRMREFLSSNGPWDQLVRYGNIELRALEQDTPVSLADDLSITPFLVPHRQEYSEVVGFRIDGPNATALYMPDIDSWEEWDEQGTRIDDLIAEVDVAYVDGTFFQNGELPGRDMTGFPHPFIAHSLERFSNLPLRERRKIRFIHLNHSNAAQYANSPEARAVRRAGMSVANELERLGL